MTLGVPCSRCGRAPVPQFELIVGLLLCSDFEGALRNVNPFLGQQQASACADMLSAALFSVNRAGHCARCHVCSTASPGHFFLEFTKDYP